tara:strand:- start:4891 stop:5658 length:768 start_codon:yes stop_codon:yes gene_type:complete
MILKKIFNNINNIREIGLFEWINFKYDVYSSKKEERIGYIRKEIIQAKEQNIDVRDFYMSKIYKFHTSEIDFLENISDIIDKLIGDKFYIVEIGTGCGLITFPIINNSRNLKKYDSYEPDRSLRKYLSKAFDKSKIFSNFKGDGSNLNETKENSADLVVAYGVFSLIPIAQVFNYICESKRVLKKNGFIAFDIFDTDSLSDELIDKFILQASRNDSRPYISRNFFLKLMLHQGFELEKEFRHKNEYKLFLVFRKV